MGFRASVFVRLDMVTVEQRITAEQTLSHPYLAEYADPSDEPTSAMYDQTFEDYDLSIEEWRGREQ